MTKTLITLLLGVIYSWPAISMAQEVDNLKIEVTGSVIDSLNNEPIPIRFCQRSPNAQSNLHCKNCPTP